MQQPELQRSQHINSKTWQQPIKRVLQDFDFACRFFPTMLLLFTFLRAFNIESPLFLLLELMNAHSLEELFFLFTCLCENACTKRANNKIIIYVTLTL